MSKAPSYKGLQPASELASRIKRSNRNSDTLHEILLRRELWHMGLRFRKNVKTLPGKPDIVFLGARVVVFCDGDFWHGRKWQQLRDKLDQGTNAQYWSAKISTNMERDLRNTALLENSGWQVIRIWETDIKRDPAAAALIVAEAVHTRQPKASQRKMKEL